MPPAFTWDAIHVWVGSDHGGWQSDFKVAQAWEMPDARWQGGGTIHARLCRSNVPPPSCYPFHLTAAEFLRLNKIRREENCECKSSGPKQGLAPLRSLQKWKFAGSSQKEQMTKDKNVNTITFFISYKSSKRVLKAGKNYHWTDQGQCGTTTSNGPIKPQLRRNKRRNCRWRQLIFSTMRNSANF